MGLEAGTMCEVVGKLVPPLGHRLDPFVHPKDGGVHSQGDGVTEAMSTELGRLLDPPNGALQALVPKAFTNVVQDRESPLGVGGVEISDRRKEGSLVLGGMALLDMAEVDAGDRGAERPESELLNPVPSGPGIGTVQ
jgi:hypothetical protein